MTSYTRGVKRGVNQARMEQAARARLASLDKDGKRRVANKEAEKEITAQRLIKAKQFPPGTFVKLGKKMVGKVVSVHEQTGTLEVHVRGSVRTDFWTPDYVELA